MVSVGTVFSRCQIILVWSFVLISLSAWSFSLHDLSPAVISVIKLPGSLQISSVLLLVLSGFDTYVLKLHTASELLFLPEGLAPFSLRKCGFSLLMFLS